MADHDHINARPARPRRRNRLWPYAMGLALVLAWSILTLPAFIHGVAPYMSADGSASGRMFGYFAGHAFLLALGAWLVVNLPFIRWQGPHPLFFFALLAAAAAPEIAAIRQAEANAAEYRYDKAQALTGKAEVLSVLWSAVRFGPQKDGRLDAQARTAGEAGRVEAAWKKMAAGMAQDARAYRGQMMVVSLRGPLSSASLSAPGGPAAARAALAQARAQLERLAARAEGRFRTYQAEVAKVAAGSADRARVEALGGKGRETRDHLDALWAVERDLLAEADAVAAAPATARAHEPKVERLASREMDLQTDFRRETQSATDDGDEATGG